MGSGSGPILLTMKSASVNISLWGIPVTINCAGGSAGGVVHAGAACPPALVINSLALPCPSIFPGTTVTMAAVCNIDTVFSDSVHTGLVDTGTGSKFHRDETHQQHAHTLRGGRHQQRLHVPDQELRERRVR